MPIEDLWYRNAIIYCLDVSKYMDSDGDGIGDFAGLSQRLSYLAGLGVTCVWLLPFSRTPNRDNGYDVQDYYSVDPKHGTFGDFVECMNYAHSLGIRVVADLVVNHTSDQHEWFQEARKDKRSPKRDWYVWADERPADHKKGVVFPGVQETTWTWDDVAGQYYFHRFYEFQPDLNTANPAVRREILKIMGFWLELGIAGFRVDAVPFIIEAKGAATTHRKDFELLHDMRDLLQWRCRDAILLAEANVPPDESKEYFGTQGDRLQLMLNFPVNQRLWYALASADIEPLSWAIEQTANIPPQAQFVQFLRSHDECDLGRLTDAQRACVFARCGPESTMQLYGRGIRRRLAPMLQGDRRRLELALSLLLSLPGTPLMQYGDEIGIWDDLSLPERECARTAMQWSSEDYGGFSTSPERVTPIVDDPEHGFRRVNVADERRDPASLLNWVERRIRARKEFTEISWGACTVIKTTTLGVLVLRYDWRSIALITVHNFNATEQRIHFDAAHPEGHLLCDVFDEDHSRAGDDGEHHITIRPYGHTWFRVGGPDPTLRRRRK